MCTIVMPETVIKNENSALFLNFDAKLACRESVRTLIIAIPPSISMVDVGIIVGIEAAMGANTPNSIDKTPSVTAAVYRDDFGPDSSPARSAVMGPATQDVCAPKNALTTEPIPLHLVIELMGGAYASLSSTAIPCAFWMATTVKTNGKTSCPMVDRFHTGK